MTAVMNMMSYQSLMFSQVSRLLFEKHLKLAEISQETGWPQLCIYCEDAPQFFFLYPFVFPSSKFQFVLALLDMGFMSQVVSIGIPKHFQCINNRIFVGKFYKTSEILHFLQEGGCRYYLQQHPQFDGFLKEVWKSESGGQQRFLHLSIFSL